MGKKGGKKGKIEKAVENAEPNLPSIPEEDTLDKNEQAAKNEPPEETSPPRKSGSILKSRSVDPERRKSSIKKSLVIDEKIQNLEDIEPAKIQSVEGEKQADVMDIPPEAKAEEEGKKKKGKKEKKKKTEESEPSEGEEEGKVQEEKPKKGKKSKKEIPEDQGEEQEKPVKKGKKDKKAKPETDEQPVVVSSNPEIQISPDEAEKPTRKGKKGKKGKTEEGEGEKKKKEPKQKKEKVEVTGDEEVKEGPKEKKGKKDKVHKVSQQTQEGEGDIASGSDTPDKIPKKQMSKIVKHKGSISELKSTESLGKKKKHKQKSSTGSSKEDLKRLHRYNASRESYESEASEPSVRAKKTSSLARGSLFDASGTVLDPSKTKISRTSAISGESSTGTPEYVIEKVDSGKTKKGKKGKKQKKEKADLQQEEEETEEEKERKRAEKEAEKLEKDAEKLEKKAAKKAALKEAKARKKAEKAEQKGDPEVALAKKELDELMKRARELGIEEDKLAALEGEEQGPKKKVSKKEKAKITAEKAEKAKAEMEAQAKRVEELIRKKQEEDRLAAIEKDKRETIEQGQRLEQLQETNVLIQDIANYNAEIFKEEKDLLEWKKYLECGKLPNPAMCDQMNTYLHLWELDLEKTSIDDASSRTTDAVKLLSDLDELIDTITIEESHKLENWKWIRQLFREYQSSSLDVATYRILRDVEHNLNRINIPTADFNFIDNYVTLCIWLRVMLPRPLPNPRRPPKPRVDINFKKMNVSVLFPIIIDCENAAIRAMYLKYDHLSDLSPIFNMPEVPPDFYFDLLDIIKKEWRTKLKYKYDNRDKLQKSALAHEAQVEQETLVSGENEPSPEQKEDEPEKHEDERKITFEDGDELNEDEEIPLVPFKQLKPTASEHAMSIEDELYDATRTKLRIEVPENVINLRKFVILGGVFHLDLLAQPPQPQDFITMDMTITGLYLPKKLEVLPFKVVYTPYVPPEPEPIDSSTSVRKLPEELEEEMKKQEYELDKLISISIKWPQHVIFLELPIVCRWDEEKNQWSNEEIHDVKHNEDKCMLSFRTGVFGIYALATYRYCNLPFQAYDIKPELDDSVTVQLTAAILMLEFNIKDGLIAITQLQNSPNLTLQEAVGKYMKLHRLKRMMKEAGIDIFPAFDAFCYVDGCCEKQWAMEQNLYYSIALIYNCFNFAWSRWNLQAGRRKIVLQMRQYSPDKGKQKNHQMLLVTPLKAIFIECTEVSQAFSEKEVESLKYCADLYHLMKITSGIFVRNKVAKASKQNVYTLAQFLTSIRVMSFS